MALQLVEQRNELSNPSQQVAQYLKSVITADTITFEEGQVTILNECLNGVLLQMPQSFHAGDILEVNFKQPGEPPTTTLFEVRWSQPVELWSESHGYLIGCRRMFPAKGVKLVVPSYFCFATI